MPATPPTPPTSKMKYGYFDDTANEYVVTNPCTPTKWINYIGTLQFGGFIDHTGGALLCAGDPALNRITKYIPQLPGSEPRGETLYLRIRSSHGYELVTPWFTPGLKEMDLFECHVGLGYQRLISKRDGIRTEVLVFVPTDAPVEIRQITVTNERDQPVEVDAVPVVEYTHFDALKQFTNADWVPQTMTSKAEWEEDGKLVLRQYAFMRQETLHNFLTCNVPVDSFETDRSRFLGNNEYATWQNPLSLQKASLGNYAAFRGDNVGVLLVKLGSLQPGESKGFITQLGQAPAEEVPAVIGKYRDETEVRKAFDGLKAFWSKYLSTFHVESPDVSFNTTVNVHNPRQCFITVNWSRYLSLYQLGLGARGLGYRDSSQDTMGAVAGAPDTVKNLLRKLMSVQNPNGSAMHQFYPLTMEANEGDSREEGENLFYGDDHLWGVLAVCAYIKETGDYAFLEESIPFYSKTVGVEDRETGTVLDHLLRAIEFTRLNTGSHGLPLLGFADWNDTVNLKGNAESLFNAHLYGRGIRELVDLLEYQGDSATAGKLQAYYAEMKDRVNQHAWDGEWYVRYFQDNGEPLGSSKNADGKIFTNAQSWAVLSGFAEGERAEKALDSVHRILNTENGIKLSWPGFKKYDESVGGVSTYPPGAKENGGIFLHSNPWVMIAETMTGNGDRAYAYYQQINPSTKNDKIDTYEIEPYVYAQNILADEHPQFGLGRNSWLSGTASWSYQAATQFILGIRPEHRGLRVDPCIPRMWDSFIVKRKFRGATYEIAVRNPDGVSKGITRMSLNGESLANNLVPIQPEGSVNEVEVIMG